MKNKLQTDAEGIADFNGLEAGTYTLTVTLANYQTYTAHVKIKTGVHSRKKITLVHV